VIYRFAIVARARNDKSNRNKEELVMVAGFHLLWTAYGWWLPNDPRGSSSQEIRVEKIADLGELYHGRKRVQPSSAELRRFYERARDSLKHPLLTFEDKDIALIAHAFGRVLGERRYTCYACAIMPDHVHVLIRKHRDHAETMIERLQTASRDELIERGRRTSTHPVWGGPGWKVFLYTQQDVARIIGYVCDNPRKAGRAPQPRPFVRRYDGWLPGCLHSR
jgi:REP element-mobilizing transposase RayT